MKEKLIASFLAALMLFAPTALAATALKDYPTFLATDHTLDAYVVVGSAAKTEDVAGAIDIALRLTELSYVEKTVTGAAGAAVDGIEKDGIGFNNNNLATGSSAGASTITNAFPSGSIVKSFHYSGLKDSTYKWKANDYDYREQVDLSGITMRNDYGTNYINGTLTMVVESGDVIYQYVFEKAINLSTATTAGTTGTIANPEYTYPINIKMLGKDFSIVSVGDSQIKMLQGSIGTATATTGITFGDYTVYSDLGSNAAWARVIIKDKDGNTKDTLIISQADSKDSSAAGLTVKVTAVRALQDGTVVGTDLVVGSTTAGVEKTYDTSADVTSTGTASDLFPGETANWGIQVSSTGFASPGSITATTANIQVVYKPTTTQYIKAGSKLSLPNNYGDLGLEGYNTDKFATITIKPITSISAYNYSADTQAFGSLNGIEITSDPAGSIISRAGNAYSKAYILLNYSTGSNIYPVMIGFYDSSKAKIIVNGTAETSTVGTGRNLGFTLTQELLTYWMNANDSLAYPFRLNYGSAGEQDWYLNVTIWPNGTIIRSMTVGTAGTQDVSIGFRNKTTPVWTTSAVPEFQLGVTLASAEAYDVNATTDSTSPSSIGVATQDILDNMGVIIVSPSANSAGDKVVFKIPAKTLAAKVYFGKLGAAAAAGAVTYHDIVPITTPVAKMDTDPEMAVGGSGRLKNIVTVGGPCINKITAEAMNLTYPACGAASTIPTNKAIIEVKDDVFTTGKKVVIVAGWEKENTRTASSVLQQYGTLLAGITASKVEVTAATTAGITPV